MTESTEQHEIFETIIEDEVKSTKKKHINPHKQESSDNEKNLFQGMQTIEKNVQLNENASPFKVFVYNLFKLRFIPFFIEFLGTMILTMSVSLTFSTEPVTGKPIPSPIQGIAVGGTLAALIIQYVHISGGHFNPAVSWSMFLRQKATLVSTVGYMLFQLIGGFTGAFIAYFIAPTTANVMSEPHEGIAIARVFVSEIMYTFFLTSCVLNCGTVKNKAEATFTGIAIGLTVIMGVVAGSAVNPAVDIGRMLVKSIIEQKPHYIQGVWIYCIGPLVGATIAPILFFMTNWDEFLDVWKEIKTSKCWYLKDHLY